MKDLGPRQRLLFRLLVVVFSVFVFACGGPEPARESASAVTPERSGSGVMPSPSDPQVETAEIPADPPVAVPAPPPAGAAPASATAETVRDDTPEAAAPAPAAAGPPPGQVDASGHRVYTNADLRSYSRFKEQFGFRDPDTTGGPGGAEPGPGEGFSEERAEEAEARARRDREETAAREAVSRLELEIAYLQKRASSLHNPFLPRVELTPEDSDAEAGMDNVERLARVNQRLADARKELDAAQTRLAEFGAQADAGHKDH